MSQITCIMDEMERYLTEIQAIRLKETLIKILTPICKEYTSTNEQLLETFLEHKRIGYAKESTLKQYSSSCRHFFEFLDGKNCLDTTKDDCKSFIIKYKNTNNVKQVTVINKICFISTFYDWLVIEDYIYKNPWKSIDRIRAPHRHKEAFSSIEVSRIKDACKTPRERAIIEFLLSTGVRANELCTIKINDCDFSNNTILITGKGDKQRIVYISPILKYYINKYLKTKEYTESDYLFTNIRSNKKLQKANLEKIINNICNPLGIKGYPHKFRRTFCTNLINQGMDIAKVQRLMGHSRIGTTVIYYDSDKDNLHNTYNSFVR